MSSVTPLGALVIASLFVIATSPSSPIAIDEAPAAVTLRRGKRAYQENCAVCHGENGDGKGMAAHMLVTQPRDFRAGQFKFRSTPSGALPADGDLLKVVTNGVRWTAMVGRADLSEADRRALVHYIKGFSPRFAEEDSPPPVAIPAAPSANRQLIEEGRQLYIDAECGKCHGARADGKGVSSADLVDERGRPLPASDLTWRPLKRGSGLVDLYLTIATGLNGTSMPAYGDALSERAIWALVNYLESMVPEDHRLSPRRVLGEEQRGWMILRMHGGMMGRGMMR